jgi:hypothetical protein
MLPQTQTAQTLIVITHSEFAQGYQRGRDWYFYGEAEGVVDDTYLVENIVLLAQRNAHQKEFRDDLYWHVGFLMGMVSGKCIPEEV